MFNAKDARKTYEVSVAASNDAMGSASIVKYIGSDNNLVISDNVTVNNVKYTITTIGANAFLNSNVVELTMPNTIKTIETKAFYNSKVLTTIKLSNRLEYVASIILVSLSVT